MANFTVSVRNHEPFEKALRRFSTKTRKSGVLRMIKKKRFYVKPSVKKKLDIQRGIRRMKKAERLAAMTPAERKAASLKRRAPGAGPGGGGPGGGGGGFGAR
jgi:small subunit ribosomal protein S21